jgi:predicted nucleotidyltransferase
MRDELTGILGRLVDLLTRNGLNRYLRDEILRDAQVIHAE